MYASPLCISKTMISNLILFFRFLEISIYKTLKKLQRRGASSKNLSVLNIYSGYKRQVKGTFSQSIIGRHCQRSWPSVRSPKLSRSQNQGFLDKK